MNMKKRLGFNRANGFVVWLMVLAMIAGCAGGNNSQPGGTDPANPTSSVKPSASEGEAAPGEPLRISVIATYYTPQPPDTTNSAWVKLQELTNTKLDMTWVPRSAYDDKISISLASNDLPQAMLALNYTAAPLVNAIKTGAFWEIGPYLSEFPNLSQMNELQFNFTKVEGKTYGLYRPRSIARHGITFRRDWLERLGLQEPANPEELYEVLRAFTKDDPDNNGQDDTLGLGEYKDIEAYLLPHVTSWFGAPNKWSVENGEFEAEFMTPEYLEGLKYIKRLYDEGLINRDFVVTEELQRTTMFSQGKSGVLLGNNDGAATLKNETLKYNADAVVDLMGNIAGPKGERVFAQQGYTGVYLFPKSSVKTEENLKQILGFFDRLLEADAINVMAWGVEGEHYRIVDGHAEQLIKQEEKSLLTDGLNELSIDDKSQRLVAKGADELLLKGEKRIQDNAAIAVPNPALGLESATWTQSKSELDKIINDAKIKFITGQLDEAGWESAIAAWLKAGGQKVLAEFADSLAKSQ
ncbi:hypothetical protein B1748_09270 [Paenibacillus sp. MY03]|nr:hypothetical protein B1748_09270 [Paenibacillus sp. MY03]